VPAPPSLTARLPCPFTNRLFVCPLTRETVSTFTWLPPFPPFPQPPAATVSSDIAPDSGGFLPLAVTKPRCVLLDSEMRPVQPLAGGVMLTRGSSCQTRPRRSRPGAMPHHHIVSARSACRVLILQTPVSSRPHHHRDPRSDRSHFHLPDLHPRPRDLAPKAPSLQLVCTLQSPLPVLSGHGAMRRCLCAGSQPGRTRQSTGLPLQDGGQPLCTCRAPMAIQAALRMHARLARHQRRTDRSASHHHPVI
jgi:hypothetical protein